MSTKYLLPCPCGRKTPVEPVQAGQKVRCTCGGELEVPTMREIALLETADSVAAGTAGKTAWGRRQGLILLGAICLVGGLAAGVFAYLKKPQPPSLEAANLSQTWQVWLQLREGVDAGLFRDQEAYSQDMKSFRTRLGTALATGGLGAILLLVGLLMAKRPGAAPPSEALPRGDGPS